MFFIICMIFGFVTLILIYKQDKKGRKFLDENNSTYFVSSIDEHEQQAIKLQVLTKQKLFIGIKRRITNIFEQLGDNYQIKLIVFFIATAVISLVIIDLIMNGFSFLFIPLWIFFIIAGIIRVETKQQKEFESSFPDALNILSGAISSGESIIHAINFVGSQLHTAVGKEFKLMGDRLQLGEPSADVFAKSCRRFPYPSFAFFIITLNANMNRGGQLKDVMTRLNRQMFNNRSIEKKKMSMTAEARISARIVCAIPFMFILLLKYISPENFNFVMFNEEGRYILYYVLVSEAIGMGIVWLLMRGVR